MQLLIKLTKCYKISGFSFRFLMMFIGCFSHYLLWAQLSPPLNCLPSKADLSIRTNFKSQLTVYASVYTDTVKKKRIWFFLDTMTGKANSLLVEIFDDKSMIQKQLFLSKDNFTSESNWEYLDFLRNENYLADKFLTKQIKKEIKHKFPQLSNQLSIFFKNNLTLTIRYSKQSFFGSWGGALQTIEIDKKQNIRNWITIDPYYHDLKMDTIEARQRSHIGRESFQLKRIIVKNKLMYMQTSDVNTTYFRRYEYNSTLMLDKIIEGKLTNDSEEVENTIIVIPR